MKTADTAYINGRVYTADKEMCIRDSAFPIALEIIPGAIHLPPAGSHIAAAPHIVVGNISIALINLQPTGYHGSIVHHVIPLVVRIHPASGHKAAWLKKVPGPINLLKTSTHITLSLIHISYPPESPWPPGPSPPRRLPFLSPRRSGPGGSAP